MVEQLVKPLVDPLVDQLVEQLVEPLVEQQVEPLMEPLARHLCLQSKVTQSKKILKSAFLLNHLKKAFERKKYLGFCFCFFIENNFSNAQF